MDIVEKDKCTGCGLCKNICPQHCITMKEDEEGFLYPHVLLEKCIDCGLCNKVCPIEHPCNPDSHPIQIVAAQHKDSAVLQSSSSGGIFSLLAEYVLKHEGVVYGAAFDKNMYLKHIRIDDENKLEKLRGSKYIQSDIGQTYLQTKEDLKALTTVAGEKVLGVRDTDGIKVYLQSSWFLVRPSGTENILKFYAETFISPEHLQQIIEEGRKYLGV